MGSRQRLLPVVMWRLWGWMDRNGRFGRRMICVPTCRPCRLPIWKVVWLWRMRRFRRRRGVRERRWESLLYIYFSIYLFWFICFWFPPIFSGKKWTNLCFFLLLPNLSRRHPARHPIFTHYIKTENIKKKHSLLPFPSRLQISISTPIFLFTKRQKLCYISLISHTYSSSTDSAPAPTSASASSLPFPHPTPLSRPYPKLAPLFPTNLSESLFSSRTSSPPWQILHTLPTKQWTTHRTGALLTLATTPGATANRGAR